MYMDLKIMTWFANINLVAQWCKCVVSVIDMQPEDMQHFRNCLVANIQDVTLKGLIKKHGSNLGFLPKWVDSTVAIVHGDVYCPIRNDLPNVDIDQHSAKWLDFIRGDNVCEEMRSSLRHSCELIIERIEASMSAYRQTQKAIDDAHSSYSDYSESDTTSEEPDEHDEPEEKTEKKRRYFRRRT